ncbi:amidohydrolase family protein [Canibacter oris]|uniref:5-methylthioadenosine/S-adenosylhomocysteine deaminase n=1 Tax=Canibacter oris TaxID=1365628 RepID=A0A840DG09_9MICO|nr:amidohydrolase [Canibacter oris]MBB4071984.1 5-methylthioadenosine/S-adenosylhomocysteine deaminase [Canibacter oris]
METVLYADALVTAGKIVKNAEIRFADGKITAVGKRGELGPVAATSEVHDLAGRILIPGLTNGHTHSAMTLLRGVSDDYGFMPWLSEVQALEQHLTHDDIRAGLELALLEMIGSGTVAFADMYYWDAALLEVVADSGMRVAAAFASVAPEVIMFPGATALSAREEMDLADQLAAEHNSKGQILVNYGPHAPYSVPRDFFVEVIERSKRTGVPIHTHIAESPAETETMLERSGQHPASYLESLGLFETKVLAAHCVYLQDAEITMFAKQGVALSHNPVSNLKLGNGVARLPEWLAADAAVSLGTDSVASNNSLDLFEEMKLAAILHRGVRTDPTAVTAAQVFEVATKRGAAAIGFPESGQLEVGKNADIVALDVTGVNAIPHESLLSHIVFAASGRDVAEVWIGGRHVFSEGEYLTLDAADIKQRAAASAKRLRQAAAAAGGTAGSAAAETV